MRAINNPVTNLAKTMTLCSFLVCSNWSYATESNNERNSYSLKSHSKAAVIDGKIDESVWQRATLINLGFENDPGEGIKAPVQTQAYIYEDGDSLYVAIRAFDPEPNNIRANLGDRDRLWADDSVTLVIDTFNDERNGYAFSVNPLGVQGDARVSDTDGRNDDSSWDAIWHSAGSIDSQGWTVEMRISFTALRFDDNNGEKTWNFALERNYPRDVTHKLASYSSDRNSKCTLCQFDQLQGFKNIEPGQNFQLTPTLTLAQQDSKDVSAGSWQKGDREQEAGLDLRWGITQDSVLNATINPDFSQVEADVTQLAVNNTFSLFFREKRPFFLDGADHFYTNSFNLVHTRNIADPDYGLKLTGKSGEHSYGLLVANDNQTTFMLPGNQGSSLYDHRDADNTPVDSQIAIARYQADIGARNSIGFLATSRQADGYANHLASVDGSYWLNDENTLQYQVAYSSSTNPDALQSGYGLEDKQQDHALSLEYAQRTRDYSFNLGYEDVGKDFRADMGFMPQVDHKTLTLGGDRTYYGEDKAFLNRFGYFANADLVYDQAGQRLSNSANIYGFANGPMQSYANFGLNTGNQFYQNQFNGIGEYYDEAYLSGYGQVTPLSGLTLRLSFRYGDRLDTANARIGEEFNTWATVEWQIGKHLSTRLDHEVETMKVDGYDFVQDGQGYQFDSGALYTANRTSLRMTYQFDIQSQLKLTVQYNDMSRNEDLYRANFDANEHNDVGSLSRYLATQLLYSYKVNPQTLVYLGYSDGGFQNDSMSKLVRNQRTVFAKFSYAWQG